MRATSRIARHPSPLPVELTPLLGRARESREIRDLVTDPAQRLITLIGPGGVGKTRLALHVAEEMLHAFDGAVAHVPLASIHDPGLVLPEIAQAFGVFSDKRDAPEDQLAEVLQDERVLLVLDNLEQVLAIAPALRNVLARCPGVTMLATSQASLEIDGEQLYPVAPLTTPGTDATTATSILESDAVALFVQRARAVNPALTVDDRAAATIAEICRRLDGLPLAIELAAARTSVLSPEALLARLSNRLQVLGSQRQGVPDRLRTMRNAVAWSYDLLTPDEQVLFRRLSVFAGGFSLEAVEAICPPLETNLSPFDVLSALVRHSVVQAGSLSNGEPRFLLLETLRDFGLEQLEAEGEVTEARLAQATWVAELARSAQHQLTGRGQDEWTQRLDVETENLRAAAEWTLANGHEDLTLLMAGATWRFCSTHGLGSDCRAWLTRALAAPGTQHSPHRAMALIGAGNLYEDMRQNDPARGYFEQAREVARSVGETAIEAQALIGLGTLDHDVGDYEEALARHAEAAELARKSGDRHTIARAVGNVGTVSYFLGRLEDTARHWEESRQILAELGDVMTEATVTSNLGVLAFQLGDLARSERLQQRALELNRRMGSTRDIPYTLVNLGETLTMLGDYTQAHDCFAEAIQLLREAGNTAIEGEALAGVARLALAEGDAPRAASLIAESLRLISEVNDQINLIEATEMLATICEAHGNHAEAIELLAAADHNREALGSTLTPWQQERKRITAACESALADTALEAAAAAGRQLDIAAMTSRAGIIARAIIGRRHAPVEVGAAPDAEEPVIEHHLTPRETEILRLLAQGKSTQKISESLYISPRTVATHITNILAKLQVTSRTAAVAYALRGGLV